MTSCLPSSLQTPGSGRSADVLIVGTGHAGAQAAIALRQQGYAGSVLMVGRDAEPPYERPPLSKDYLAGEKPFQRLYIRPPEFWSENSIELLLGTEVAAVDSTSKIATLRDGGTIRFEHLIWAAGGEPRQLACPGGGLKGVHCVRDKSDVDRIRTAVEQGAARIAVIGAGYVGLEAAATLAKIGCRVTVIEQLNRVLARVAGEDISTFYQEIHRSHGIDIRLGALVESIDGTAGSATGVRLASGDVVACDLVIVGIGISPSIAPLAAAGARTYNGIEVDALCRTSLPGIYAIGDCACYPGPAGNSAMTRLESVQNANDMAITAAKAICGDSQPYAPIPWFWSNQFDLRLQTIGLSAGHDHTVLRGSPADRTFSVVYLKHGRVIALDCVNATRDYVDGRKLVESGAKPSAIKLADSGVRLRDLVN